MKKIFERIHSDTKATAVFYGTISSLIAAAIIEFSPNILSYFANYSFGLLVKFIDYKYIKAATLEPTNYSFFLLAFLFVIISVIWSEVAGRFKKVLSNKTDDEQKQNNKKEIPKWAPKTFWFLNIGVVCYLIFGLLWISGEVIVLNAITDFKQHLRIITPYIKQTQKDKILSDWSQMRSNEEYKNIYIQLIEIAEEKKLNLYRNRNY